MVLSIQSIATSAWLFHSATVARGKKPLGPINDQKIALFKRSNCGDRPTIHAKAKTSINEAIHEQDYR
jgi:hypothetical protein